MTSDRTVELNGSPPGVAMIANEDDHQDRPPPARRQERVVEDPDPGQQEEQTGNWKASPKASITVVTKLMYSLSRSWVSTPGSVEAEQEVERVRDR